ncbi:MAG: DNA polymerase III subunit delta, partial [Anaerolineae bacterium]
MATSPPILFLYGNDDFAISRRLKEIRAELDDEPNADLNVTRLDGRTLSAETLQTALQTTPFLASQRLVLLENPSAACTTPQARKRFLASLENIPPTSRLVMYEFVETRTYRDPRREAREDERHWLVKWGRKKDGVGLERYPLPTREEMSHWIIRETKRQGGDIEESAAGYLAGMVGQNTRQAAQEIAKLLAYVNWERTITLQDVEAVSVLTAQESIFDLVDALALGDGKKAQTTLHRLLEEEDPFRIFGMIVRQFRLLILAREV